jgi:hypothetical protein
MSKFREKAEAQTEEIIGQMIGDELLVKEGKERSRKVTEIESGASNEQRADGKRDLKRGMPPPPRRSGQDQGIVRDERGQDQPRDKARAQQVSGVDKGGDRPGQKVSARDSSKRRMRT